ncbi:siderophore ABC transporter substrate-binding protein [Neobacillus niacini]|jgi:iron complex transport system substrate-binding protein|uniref:siderophore ABC transporter substrate-binding protein n=1 Tax=Neobacillus niacini TaxID=86668 RepID=UPI001C8F02CC|nr:siderophore ABC transporter substrate-binding protein [Neobacillus niacini]MBY0144964.1 siderophore ABC transporter substrate-binding protein [Neobacillus niacini]
MKKLRFISIMFTLILLLAACGSTEETSKSSGSEGEKTEEKTKEVTITHKYGEVTIEKNPKKVVVFDFGVLDALDTFGVEIAALPQAIVPKTLEKYAGSEYTNVGSLKEPDFEALHELQPDVIFISGRQAELYDQFAEIAPTVFVEVDYANYMSSLEKNFKLLAEVFEREDVLNSKMDELKASIETLNKEASADDSKALILLANEGKVSAYGPGSRYGFVHDVFGFKAVDENLEVSQHGQSVTFEYILEKNPDVLFVIDRSAAVGGEVGAKETIENELVQKTNAYKNGKIVYLDAVNWYIAGNGITSTQSMVEEVKAALE